MTAKNNQRRILERAERLLGRKQIADGLKVSEEVVAAWCDGRASLSDSQLLRLSHLLAKYGGAKN